MGEEDCIAMSSEAGTHYGWVYHHCWSKENFICQARQITHQTKKEVIYQPGLVMPLDNLTYYKPASKDNVDKFLEHLVAFPHIPVHQTELDKPAQFLGTQGSYLELENSAGGPLHFKYGLTISLWINIFSIKDDTKSVIVDFSELADDNSFRLYLNTSEGKTNLVAESCNFDCSEVSYFG